jgi:hypothetical protein
MKQQPQQPYDSNAKALKDRAAAEAAKGLDRSTQSGARTPASGETGGVASSQGLTGAQGSGGAAERGLQQRPGRAPEGDGRKREGSGADDSGTGSGGG